MFNEPAWIYTQHFQVCLNVLILSVPFFFVWKGVLKKYISHERKRMLATVVASIITSSILYAAFVWFVIYTISYEPQKDFNITTWSTDKERYQMADDLIERKVLVGKDSSEVKAMLGSPERRSDSTNQVELRDSWTYDMGMGSFGFGVKFHTLIIKFHENKVSEVIHGGTTD